MKRLTRGPAPAPLGDSDVDTASRRQWYADLRGKDGKIRPRWNQRDDDGKQPIRKAVRAISGSECAWCGTRVPGANMQVDHYLPKEWLPRLSYCWVNLLPSCGSCNRRKLIFRPSGIDHDSLYEPALGTHGSADASYDPETILDAHPRRLVEPAFEDPAKHLAFEPVLATYVSVTDAGATTISRLFNERDDAASLQTLQKRVFSDVERSESRADLENSLQLLIDLVGRSFYVRAFAACWLKLNPPPWTTQRT